jgi:hypothetical protein
LEYPLHDIKKVQMTKKQFPIARGGGEDGSKRQNQLNNYKLKGN